MVPFGGPLSYMYGTQKGTLTYVGNPKKVSLLYVGSPNKREPQFREAPRALRRRSITSGQLSLGADPGATKPPEPEARSPLALTFPYTPNSETLALNPKPPLKPARHGKTDFAPTLPDAVLSGFRA